MPSTFFGWIWFILQQYGPLFLRGTGVTLFIALIGTILGFGIGLLVALVKSLPVSKADPIGRKLWRKPVFFLLDAYVEIFRGTPMIVQAMVIYYGTMMYTSVKLSPLVASLIIVSINTGAYMAEIVRGGILSVDKGQREAAHSIGMTHAQAMTSVVLPQAIRNIMPSIGNEFVVNIKDSSVLNVISVSELYFVSKSAAGTYYKYFEVFFITACVYFVLTFSVTRILRLIEKKLQGPDHYVIYGSQSDSKAEIHYTEDTEEA